MAGERKKQKKVPKYVLSKGASKKRTVDPKAKNPFVTEDSKKESE